MRWLLKTADSLHFRTSYTSLTTMPGFLVNLEANTGVPKFYLAIGLTFLAVVVCIRIVGLDAFWYS